MEQQSALSDSDLVERVEAMAADLRRGTAEIVRLLAEVDARNLHLALGYSSLFAYCVERLRMSEGEAANRITAARAARRFPVVLELLAIGDVTLTTIRLLAPHLSAENHAEVLSQARGLTRPRVEELVARLAPRSAVASSLRAVPASSAAQLVAPTRPLVSLQVASVPSSPAPPAALKPVAPELYRLSVNMTAATRRLWEDARRFAEGDDATVLARVLAAALPVLQKRKAGVCSRPRRARPSHPDTRHTPAETRRVVWVRDGGRCAYVGRDGHRCTATRHLQYHHLRPYAAGGSMDPENIELRCPAHNRYEAQVYFAAARTGREAEPAPSTPYVPEHVRPQPTRAG